jgi:3-oxosteroid 1-dehydrogenase
MSVDHWDYETGLLVVGAGAAGMTAALTAKTEGLEALVLEKTGFYGGTTALSAGVVWAPNNSLMKQAGIVDTPEDALAYLKHNIGNRVAEAKLKAYVTHAPRMVDYMLANSALEFKIVDGFPDYRPETPGSSMGGRAIEPKVFSGRKLGDMFSQLRGASAVVPGGLVCSVAELRKLAGCGAYRPPAPEPAGKGCSPVAGNGARRTDHQGRCSHWRARDAKCRRER